MPSIKYIVAHKAYDEFISFFADVFRKKIVVSVGRREFCLNTRFLFLIQNQPEKEAGYEDQIDSLFCRFKSEDL
jgi:hypothetical protein